MVQVLTEPGWQAEYVEGTDREHMARLIREELASLPLGSVSDISISHPTPTSALIAWRQALVTRYLRPCESPWGSQSLQRSSDHRLHLLTSSLERRDKERPRSGVRSAEFHHVAVES
jgi:hypothetical protein